MSNTRRKKIIALAAKHGVGRRTAANMLAAGANGRPPAPPPPPPPPPRLSWQEQFSAMNYESWRVTFSTYNPPGGPSRTTILFGGERYSEDEAIDSLEDAVSHAELGERGFFQVMTSTRNILRHTWGVMSEKPERAEQWDERWVAAAERFADLETQWGERPDRFWLHAG